MPQIVASKSKTPESMESVAVSPVALDRAWNGHCCILNSCGLCRDHESQWPAMKEIPRQPAIPSCGMYTAEQSVHVMESMVLALQTIGLPSNRENAREADNVDEDEINDGPDSEVFPALSPTMWNIQEPRPTLTPVSPGSENTDGGFLHRDSLELSSSSSRSKTWIRRDTLQSRSLDCSTDSCHTTQSARSADKSQDSGTSFPIRNYDVASVPVERNDRRASAVANGSQQVQHLSVKRASAKSPNLVRTQSSSKESILRKTKSESDLPCRRRVTFSEPLVTDEFPVPRRHSAPLQSPRPRCLVQEQPVLCADFSCQLLNRKVRLAKAVPINDSGTRQLLSIHVMNMSYEKSVFVRITEDSWQTHCDFHARFSQSMSSGQVDVFETVVYLSERTVASLPYRAQFAVGFSCSGTDHWDNNYNQNYDLQ